MAYFSRLLISAVVLVTLTTLTSKAEDQCNCVFHLPYNSQGVELFVEPEVATEIVFPGSIIRRPKNCSLAIEHSDNVLIVIADRGLPAEGYKLLIPIKDYEPIPILIKPADHEHLPNKIVVITKAKKSPSSEINKVSKPDLNPQTEEFINYMRYLRERFGLRV